MDHGAGVVCAATWSVSIRMNVCAPVTNNSLRIMPAAMVARPWDFPPPEAVSESSDDIDTAGVAQMSDAPADTTPYPSTITQEEVALISSAT
jgi:hypothetical protein